MTKNGHLSFAVVIRYRSVNNALSSSFRASRIADIIKRNELLITCIALGVLIQNHE